MAGVFLVNRRCECQGQLELTVAAPDDSSGHDPIYCPNCRRKHDVGRKILAARYIGCDGTQLHVPVVRIDLWH